MCRVRLNSDDFSRCINLAIERMMTSGEQGLNHATTYQRDNMKRLEEEVVGVCGELAICVATGREYTWPINTFHRIPDAAGVEVRSTWRSNNSLIIRDNDADERWFYLVTGDDPVWFLSKPPVMTIRGSMRGGAAKRDEWLRNPNSYRASWFVPQSELTPYRGPRKEIA